MTALARWLLIAGLALLPGLARAAPAYVIGVLPIQGTRMLVERYEPLRAWLEARLKQPVRVESAPDFTRFHARTLAGEFDLTVTAAHFARIAQKDAGFQPLAQFTPDHDALLIARAEHPLVLPDDLKGKTLAVIDRLAITVMAALNHLEERGLEPERDFSVGVHRSHAGVAQALASGQAAAAVTTSQGMTQIPETLRRQISVHKHIADIPAFVFLARPDATPARVAELKRLLLAFPGAAEGEAFLARTGYQGIVPATEANLRRADACTRATRKALRQ